MRVVKADDGIIRELEHNKISKEMIHFFKTSKWLVLEDLENEIIGAAGIGGSFNVAGVEAKKEYQGKGLGVLLQKNMIEEAKEKGYSYITGLIDVKNNESIKLHKKLGFKTMFQINYAENITQNIVILILKPRGKIMECFLKIFNTKIGMIILAYLLKTLKSFFPRLVNLNAKELPNPIINYIIKNFKKI